VRFIWRRSDGVLARRHPGARASASRDLEIIPGSMLRIAPG
jgi:hypothetical protein